MRMDVKSPPREDGGVPTFDPALNDTAAAAAADDDGGGDDDDDDCLDDVRTGGSMPFADGKPGWSAG